MNHAKYLDPKTHITFIKVFGNNPDLLTSLLNSMLPAGQEEDRIVEILKEPSPEIRRSPFSTTVCTQCRNGRGRTAVVETRLIYTWTSRKQVLTELTGDGLDSLQPVYSLNILNDSIPDCREYYHDIGIVSGNRSCGYGLTEGLHLITIEIPHVRTAASSLDKTAGLWLRFLKEIDGSAAGVAPELLSHPEIGKAVRLLDSSLYTDEELRDYTAFIHYSRALKTAIHGVIDESYGRGCKKGFEEGFSRWYKEGVNTGIIAGIQQQQRRSAGLMKADGVAEKDILRWTGIQEHKIDAVQPIW